MAEEPEWDDPRWRLTRNPWIGRMWGPIPVDLIWFVYIVFLIGRILYAVYD